MSTSAASTLIGCPSNSKLNSPVVSKAAISSWDSASIRAATSFISLPNFLPMTRKLHFTFFTKMPCPSTKESSFTFTSCLIRSATASICFFWVLSMAGIIICANGWRTFILTLRRNAKTIEVMRWAMSIRASRSVSMTASFATGQRSKWILSQAPPKSLYSWSA